jgi:hypothetical protein
MKMLLAFFTLAAGCFLLSLSCGPRLTNPFEKPYEIVYKTPEKVFKVGDAVVLDTPSVGGDRPITLRIAPSLPTGLVFDTANGLISGIPKDTSSRKEYSVTAINSSGNMSVLIYIKVLPEAPRDLRYSPDNLAFTIAVPLPSIKPSFLGGEPKHYSSMPDLPSGLRIDVPNGIIYGTPAMVTPKAIYTVIAGNAGGTTQTTISIAVDSAIAKDSTIVGPSGLKAVRSDSLHVLVSWNRVPLADSYVLFRSLNSGAPGYQQLKALNDTFFIDSVKYNDYYYVQSRRGNNTSTAKDTIAVKDTVSVKPVNHPPFIVTELRNRTMKTGKIDTISIVAADLDVAQTLAITPTNLDSVKALFAPDTAALRWVSKSKDTALIIFAPGTKSGTYRFDFSVSDGIETIRGSITEYVGNVNHPPEWRSKSIVGIVSDGSTFSLSLKDSCSDPDSGQKVKFRLVSDSTRCKLTGDSLFTFLAGTLDTVVHSIAIVATDGQLADTAIVTISLTPVYFTLSTSTLNGAVTISPNKTKFRMAETATLTAVPTTGYEFTGWSGSITSTDNPLKVKMDDNKVETASFQRYSEAQCNRLTPGASINRKIQDLSALPGGSTICPDQGKYEEGTVEIEGKVSVQVKGAY